MIAVSRKLCSYCGMWNRLERNIIRRRGGFLSCYDPLARRCGSCDSSRQKERCAPDKWLPRRFHAPIMRIAARAPCPKQLPADSPTRLPSPPSLRFLRPLWLHRGLNKGFGNTVWLPATFGGRLATLQPLSFPPNPGIRQATRLLIPLLVSF